MRNDNITPEELNKQTESSDKTYRNWPLLFPDYDNRNFITHSRIRKLVFQKTNGVCAYCGKKFSDDWHDKFHIDHLFPWSVFHNNNPIFLFPCCGECNSTKRDHTPTEWQHIFESIHGTDWFWYQKAYTTLEINAVYGDNDPVEPIAYSLGGCSEFRDTPTFEDHTICCGRLDDVADLCAAIKQLKDIGGIDLSSSWDIDQYSFAQVKERVWKVYSQAKEHYPNDIPEIVFQQ